MSARSDRFVSVGLSVLLHAGIVGLLVYGWWRFQHRPQPVSALAIDATVVSSAALRPASRAPAPAPARVASAPPPAPAPAPAEDQVLPPPDAAARAAAAQEEAAHDLAVQQAAQLKAQRRAEQQARVQAQQKAQELADQQAQADAARKAQEQAQQTAREEARRKAREEAARKAQAEAERVAKAQAKRQAESEAQREAVAEQARQVAEQKRKAEAASQADLQRSLAEEERVDAAQASGAMASWEQQIQARIQRAWIRPPSARPGIECTLLVTQVPGGEITNVKLGSCNGDEAVRESIETAAYRASPLPPPPDPALFERNLEITFKPTD